ncbi:hypothetical protein [Limnoraphis robusta]|uniref:Phage tail protein n=1 Tax=Limnoraphis robusta CCNP1315 TaxID=3110306 RepID=A0ABU5TTU8_9CYAN|nr:hypothetical protein [Limnoraphis robusta]MEA5518061.1 hypothetical protein [Limnoraphis robusta CCNP1315]MEA5547844.1 hypothetical protein [Limnoraphis robusta CCNP1324]
MSKIKIMGLIPKAAIFDIGRTFKTIRKDDNPGVIIAKVIGGTVTGVVETPFSLLEGLLYRGPLELFRPDMLNSEVIFGEFDIPKVFRTEDLFSQIENIGLTDSQTTILRQSFINQYSENYSLHRLDFNFTPLLYNDYRNWRIMDIEIQFNITPEIETTDVFPQTKWEDEGLDVEDHVYLDAKGHFTAEPELSGDSIPVSVTSSKIGTTVEGEVGRKYFYKIKYSTQIPTITGQARTNGFGWRLLGTYHRYIPSGTQRFAAILLVPKHIRTATISGKIACGITNQDRRDPEYPSHRALKYGFAKIPSTPLSLGG